MNEPGPLPAQLVVICDANMFYSVVLTDLLLSLAVTGLFSPRWTEQIHDEWVRNLLADRPDLDPRKIARRRQQMDTAIDECLIEGYEDLIDGLQLPDPADRHVLAAAIRAQAQLILTFNLKDFPASALTPYGLTALAPDEFFSSLLQATPDAVQDTLETMRARKTRPPLSRAELLHKLEKQQLSRFVRELHASGYQEDA